MVSKRLSVNGKTPARVCTAEYRAQPTLEFDLCRRSRMNDLSQRTKYNDRLERFVGTDFGLVSTRIEWLRDELHGGSEDVDRGLIDRASVLAMKLESLASNRSLKAQTLKPLVAELKDIYEVLDGHVNGLVEELDEYHGRAISLCYGDAKEVAKALAEHDPYLGGYLKPPTWKSIHAMDNRALSMAIERWQLDAPNNGFENLEAAADWVCAQLSIQPSGEPRGWVGKFKKMGRGRLHAKEETTA